jgi:hypothetical protein
MSLWASYKKKNMKKNIFSLHSYNQWRKESDPELDPDQDPLVRGTDPGIRIRTKMSRIPNTDWWDCSTFLTPLKISLEMAHKAICPQ